MAAADDLLVDDLIEDRHLVLCCGAGDRLPRSANANARISSASARDLSAVIQQA
jgi:hypothetical protein